MPQNSNKKPLFKEGTNIGMSNLTTKQRWYQENREQRIESARQWRLEHLERYRELQKLAKRRKREQLATKTVAYPAVVTTPRPAMFVPAPGWDYYVHGDYTNFCLARGIDPKKSWTEDTDVYFG